MDRAIYNLPNSDTFFNAGITSKYPYIILESMQYSGPIIPDSVQYRKTVLFPHVYQAKKIIFTDAADKFYIDISGVQFRIIVYYMDSMQQIIGTRNFDYKVADIYPY
jgi:hypothetical protein